jgi:hypothetical protein
MSHINSVAMLADLSVSQWTARKVDKARTAELTETAHANSKAAHVSKKLVLSDELNAIAKLVTTARETHKRLTSPWAENGARILSVAMYLQYMREMELLEIEFRRLVPLFVNAYPDIRDDAAREYAALGKLFDATDYPQPSRIAAKFAWRHSIFEIPSADDFRCTIGDDQIARVKANIEATVNERVTNATRDIFERIHESVGTLANGLSEFKADKSGKERGTFRDSLIGNVAALVDLLPGLNFTNDARVNDMIKGMEMLTRYDAKTLRHDDRRRIETIAIAKGMVDAVSDMLA